MKTLLFGTALILLLVACAPADEQAAPAASPTVAQEEITDTATSPPLPPSPTAIATNETEASNPEGVEAASEENTIKAPTATAMPPTETAVEATAEVEVAVDGRTEDGAYFMGRADAPVRMIDYSDFM